MPSASPPASVTGAVAAHHRRGRVDQRQAVLRHEQQLARRRLRVLERRGRLGVERERRVEAQFVHAARAAAAAIAAIASQSRDVVADEHHRLLRVLKHQGVLQLVGARDARVRRDTHGHAEVHLGERVDEADAVDHVGRAERAPRARCGGRGSWGSRSRGRSSTFCPLRISRGRLSPRVAQGDLARAPASAPIRPGRAGCAHEVVVGDERVAAAEQVERGPVVDAYARPPQDFQRRIVNDFALAGVRASLAGGKVVEKLCISVSLRSLRAGCVRLLSGWPAEVRDRWPAPSARRSCRAAAGPVRFRPSSANRRSAAGCRATAARTRGSAAACARWSGTNRPARSRGSDRGRTRPGSGRCRAVKCRSRPMMSAQKTIISGDTVKPGFDVADVVDKLLARSAARRAPRRSRRRRPARP